MTDRMQQVLEKQRASFTAAMPEPMSVRKDRIDRAVALLVDHAEAFAKAVSADFGHRSREQTLMTDIMPSIGALKHAKKHMEAWARAEKRKPMFPLGLIGAKAEVVYPAQGRGRCGGPVELPGGYGDGADGGHIGRRQPGDGETLRIHRARL
jgi:coniferyl-aldehyde dehydrogenase